MPDPLHIFFEAELNGVGEGWTALTGDIMFDHGAIMRYGIPGNDINDRVGTTGVLQFQLDNSSDNSAGTFNYYNPASSDALSGWDLGIRVRPRFQVDTRVTTLDGTYTSDVSVGAVTGLVSSDVAPSFTGTSDAGEIFTTDLDGDFDGASGTLSAWVQLESTEWADTSDILTVLCAATDSDNCIYMAKDAAANTFRAERVAGGTTKELDFDVSGSDTDWHHLAVSWSDVQSSSDVLTMDGTYASDVVVGGVTGITAGEVAPTFDGTTDGANAFTSDFASVFSSKAGSVSLWFRVGEAGFDSDYQYPLVNSEVDSDNYVHIGMLNQANLIFVCDYMAGGTFNRTQIHTVPADTDWHHIVFTWSDSAMGIYYDGSSDNYTVDDSTDAFGTWAGDIVASKVGAPMTFFGTYGFIGDIAHTAYWHKALSAADASAIYTASATQEDTILGSYSNSLAAYWPMGDTDGTTMDEVYGGERGDSIKLYWDGTLQGQDDSLGTWAGAIVEASVGGNLSFGSTLGFVGSICHAAMFGAALADSDIQTIYQGRKEQFHAVMGLYPKGLIGYWPLDETSGTTIEEESETEHFYKPHFWIENISPEPGTWGELTVDVSCVGWFDYAARQSIGFIPAMTDARTHTAVDAIASRIAPNPPQVRMQGGREVFPYLLYRAGSDETAMTEFQRLSMSELGRLYYRGASNRDGFQGGVLWHQGRHDLIVDSTTAVSLSDDPTSDILSDMSTTGYSRHWVYNQVESVVETVVGDTDIATLYSMDGTPQIKPDDSLTIICDYRDTDIGRGMVGAYDVTTPVLGTDITVNSASDGSGTDLLVSTDDIRTVTLTTSSDNLLDYYMLNDASGTAADDQVDTDNASYKGTVTLNQTGLADGRKAILTGSNGYVSLDNLSSDVGLSIGSLSLWFKLASTDSWTDGAARGLAQLKYNGSNYIDILRSSDDNTVTARHMAGGTSNTIDDTDLTTTDWLHVAASWTSTDDKFILYTQGVEVGSSSDLGPYSSDVTADLATIGLQTNNYSGAYFAHGAVWNSVLTSDNVNAIYQAGASAAGVTVSPAVGPVSTKVDFNNNSSDIGYITKLDVRGYKLKEHQSQTVQELDQTSIDSYGLNALPPILLPYEQDIANGRRLTKHILQNRKDPVNSVDTARYRGNRTTDMLDAAVRAEPGQKYALTESVTLLDSDEFFVQQVQYDIYGEKEIDVQLVLLPGDFESEFYFDWAFDATFESGSPGYLETSASALTTNLVAYYELNETSGARVDVHGGFDMSDHNTVLYSSDGKQGNAADFESGASEYLAVDTTDLSFSTDSFTVVGWIKPESLNGDIWGVWNGATEHSYLLRGTSAPGFYYSTDNAAYPLLSSTDTISTGTWAMLTIQQDLTAGTVGIQVNDNDMTTAAISGNIAAPAGWSVFAVGCQFSTDNPTNFYDGLVDELGLWRKALDSDELSNLYNSGSGLSYSQLSSITTTTDAAYNGAYSLLITAENGTDNYGAYTTLPSSDLCAMETAIDINTVTMDTDDEFDFMQILDSGDAVIARAYLTYDSDSNYKVGAALDDDGGTETITSEYTITDDWHVIRLAWANATKAGADDGYLRLYIDGTVQETITGVDNDTVNADEVRFGAIGVDAGSSGTIYLDDCKAGEQV